MPTYNKNILTNAGSRLLSRVDGGADQIKFSKVAFSSEDLKSLNDDQVKALTSINPIELSAVPQVYLNDDTGETNIRSYVSNENSAKGLYVSTYAVFAKDSNDREILFSVECSDTPDYLIPNPDGSHPSGLLYNLKINVSDTNNVVFTSDTQVYATKNELEALNRVALKFKGEIPSGTDVENLTETGIHSVGWGSKDIKHLPVKQPCWGTIEVYNNGPIYQFAYLNGQVYYKTFSGNPAKWQDWAQVVREDDLVDLENNSLATNDLTINHQLTTALGPTGDKSVLNSGIFEQKLANGNRVNRINWDGIYTDADLYVHGEIHGPTIENINRRFNQIGGTNLVRNSGNIQNWDYWGRSDANRVIITHGFFENGTVNVMGLNNSSSSENYLYSDNFVIKTNTDYTISFDVSGSWNLSSMDVFFIGQSNPSDSDDEVGIVFQPVDGYKPDNSWSHRIKVTFNSNNAVKGYLRFDNNGSTNGQDSILLINNIKFEEGTVATAWSPCPADSTNLLEKYLTNAINNEVIRADNKYVEKNSHDRDWIEYRLWTNDVNDRLWIYLRNGIIFLQGTMNVNQGDTEAYKNAAKLIADGLPIRGLEDIKCDLKFTLISITETSNNHTCRLRIKDGYLVSDWLATGTYDFGGIALPIA